jgi:hypothetical protein
MSGVCSPCSGSLLLIGRLARYHVAYGSWPWEWHERMGPHPDVLVDGRDAPLFAYHASEMLSPPGCLTTTTSQRQQEGSKQSLS